MSVQVDHLLWAAPDLDAGTDLFADLSGARPVTGGSHPGFGTRNSLLSFSPTTYLEVIAPDPAQDLDGNLGGEIAALSGPKLWLFALATDDLEAAAQGARSAGVTVEEPIRMNRTTPDGVRLDWSIMRIADERWPGKLPFFIDWQGSPHPAGMTPGARPWCRSPRSTRMPRRCERSMPRLDAMFRCMAARHRVSSRIWKRRKAVWF